MKIVTYNVQSGINTDNVYDPAGSIALLKELNPEIVALQEVSICREDLWAEKYVCDSKTFNYAAEAAARLNMKYHFGITMKRPGNGLYGNAVLSEHEFEYIEDFVLPFPPEAEKRIAVITKVHAEQTFYMVSIHLAYQGEYEGDDEGRAQALAALISHLDEKQYYPAVIAGDMNSTVGYPSIDFMHEHCDVANDLVSPDIPTAKSRKRGWQQMDFICCYPKNRLHIKSCKIIERRGPSDHCPVWADIAF